MWVVHLSKSLLWIFIQIPAVKKAASWSKKCMVFMQNFFVFHFFFNLSCSFFDRRKFRQKFIHKDFERCTATLNLKSIKFKGRFMIEKEACLLMTCSTLHICMYVPILLYLSIFYQWYPLLNVIKWIEWHRT